MIFRRWTILALPLILYGCQLPAPMVLAMPEDGGIVFHARERGIWLTRIFGWDDAAVAISGFSVERGGRPIWRLVKGQAAEGCVDRATFPLRYGEERCGMATRVKARELKPGHRYDVRLGATDCALAHCDDDPGKWWSGSVVASFTVRRDGSVDNISPDE